MRFKQLLFIYISPSAKYIKTMSESLEDDQVIDWLVSIIDEYWKLDALA